MRSRGPFPVSSSETLSLRALNRALLERQMLLRRARISAPAAIERLVGMQAQVPNAPYVGLWTRLVGFRPEDLAQLITGRQAARMTLMRATIHLVSARDAVALRPLIQPVLERNLYVGSPYGRRISGVDIAKLVAAGQALLEEQPRTGAELGKMLQKKWPEQDASALSYAVQKLTALVQVPPRGVWGASGQARWTTVQAWIGRSQVPAASLDQFVTRYLSAFGPATVRDMQTWSGLTRLGEVIERLRPRLRTFRDDRGNELFDVRDGPRPDPDTPAPPRFLPEYDNVFLGHWDRRRIVADEHRTRAITLGSSAPVLIDGFIRGMWKIERRRDLATLVIQPLDLLRRQELEALAEEGTKLLRFAAAEARIHDIRFASRA